MTRRGRLPDQIAGSGQSVTLAGRARAKTILSIAAVEHVEVRVAETVAERLNNLETTLRAVIREQLASERVDWVGAGMRPFPVAFSSARALVAGDESEVTIQEFPEYLEHLERIVIVGGPGSGKSVLLNTIALMLNELPEYPIVDVFSLATWARSEGRISRWIASEISRKYEVPGTEAMQLVLSGRILPLLDGLDEVPRQQGDACAQEIARFVNNSQTGKLVLTSRITEFAEVQGRAPAFSSFEILKVQPLSRNTIISTLASDDLRHWRQLIDFVNTSPKLESINWLSTPLMLGMIVSMFGEPSRRSPEELITARDPPGVLWDARIETATSRGRKAGVGVGTMRYLRFIATSLSAQNRVELRLHELNTLTEKSRDVGIEEEFQALLPYPPAKNWAFAGVAALFATGLIAFVVSSRRWAGWPAVITLVELVIYLSVDAKVRSSGVRIRIRSSPPRTNGVIQALLLWSVAMFILVSGSFYIAASSFVRLSEATLVASSLAAGLLVSTVVGSVRVVAHYATRVWLAARSLLPLRLITFVDWAVTQGLFRRVGSGLQFVHLELQDHLSSVTRGGPNAGRIRASGVTGESRLKSVGHVVHRVVDTERGDADAESDTGRIFPAATFALFAVAILVLPVILFWYSIRLGGIGRLHALSAWQIALSVPFIRGGVLMALSACVLMLRVTASTWLGSSLPDALTDRRSTRVPRAAGGLLIGMSGLVVSVTMFNQWLNTFRTGSSTLPTGLTTDIGPSPELEVASVVFGLLVVIGPSLYSALRDMVHSIPRRVIRPGSRQ